MKTTKIFIKDAWLKPVVKKWQMKASNLCFGVKAFLFSFFPFQTCLSELVVSD